MSVPLLPRGRRARDPVAADDSAYGIGPKPS